MYGYYTCNLRYVTCTQAQENPLNRRCTTAREALEGSLMFLFIDKTSTSVGAGDLVTSSLPTGFSRGQYNRPLRFYYKFSLLWGEAQLCLP